MSPEVKEAYSILLSDKGQVLLAHWRRKFSYDNRTTMVENDPYMTAFQEGQRVVWRSILQDLEQSLTSNDPQPKEATNE